MTVTTTHAFTDDALANHDAVALAALVRDGTLSAHEVATAAVARARAADATLNAVVLDVYDAAIARSAASCSTEPSLVLAPESRWPSSGS